MRISNRLSAATGLRGTTVTRLILATLVGGVSLALVLSTVDVSAGRALARLASSTDPPCGPLDGITIDPMETVGEWHVVQGTHAISAVLRTVQGYSGQAIRLSYNLSTTSGLTDNWVQLRRDFSPPLDLSSGDHLRLFHRGTTPNSLQVGLVSAAGENYFATDWNQATHALTWTYATWDFRGLGKDGASFPDYGQVKAMFISVKTGDDEDAGGRGSFAVDELQYLTIASRTVPSDFEPVTASPTITQQAADWIAGQQQPGGLLKSWQEESPCWAWLYDQAVGLIALSESGHITAADQLVTRLHELQQVDGYWYAGYDCLDSIPIDTTTPVGANAWMAYALARYDAIRRGPSMTPTVAYTDARECARWLASVQRPEGSLPALPGEASTPTEPNLDAWWAFQATGYCTQARQLQDFLLRQVWDDEMGRFRSSADAHQIFLDNQTWGAGFLRAIGREADARRALSYARWTLAATSTDGHVCGFDGAGPFSVWNEGTLQYIAAQGENSQYYWGQVAGQQAPDGGLPGSPDDFRGYIVWLTRMHGVAPASWLYFAGTGGPFRGAPCTTCYLPIILRNS